MTRRPYLDEPHADVAVVRKARQAQAETPPDYRLRVVPCHGELPIHPHAEESL